MLGNHNNRQSKTEVGKLINKKRQISAEVQLRFLLRDKFPTKQAKI